jgi:uncharacterized membrane protein YsdA (DUF1294 family)
MIPLVEKQVGLIYLVTVGITSVMAFVAYGVDKRLSIRRQRRISERTLHVLALLGGWPGAWLAQRVFRHKTRKTPFRVMYFCTVGLHAASVAALLYWWASPDYS